MYRTVYDRFGMNDIPKVYLSNLWKANKKPVDSEKPIGADGYAPNYIPPKVYPANLFTTYSEDMHFGRNFDLKKEADSEWWGIATTEEIPGYCEDAEATVCDDIVDAIFGFLASHTDPEDAWEDDDIDDGLDEDAWEDDDIDDGLDEDAWGDDDIDDGLDIDGALLGWRLLDPDYDKSFDEEGDDDES